MLVLLALACRPPTAPDPQTCDGVACDTPYDAAVYATTHNSMSNADDGWVAPNQEHGIEDQLAAGIRGLMLDVHWWQDDVWLCHGDDGAFYTCTLGRRSAAEAFAALDDWLGAHPTEVLTLILESYVTADQLEEAMGPLVARARVQVAGEPWPTLGELADTGEQVVVLSDRDGGARPWLLDVWAHAWDTDWSIADPGEFDCAVGRGDGDNPLFILNHFVSDPLPSASAAAIVNDPAYLEARARGCEEQTGRRPNFLAVDFYATGDVVAAAAALEP